MKAERRFLQAEVRAVGDTEPKIVGYAAKFGVRSHDLGGFIEILAAGAFDECLAGNPDILGLFNHNMDSVLGRTSSGTMRVTVDAVGLRYEIDPPDTQLARDLMVSMRRNDIRGSSFGFYCLDPDPWIYDADTDTLLRVIKKASIFDCSVVTDPAYPDADAAVRSQFPEGNKALQLQAAERRAALLPASVPAGWSAAEQWDMLEQLELHDLSTL